MKLTLPDFSRANVLVFGDAILDRYWDGNTARISPEAPVPVVHVRDEENRLGGAANVALNIRTLGASAKLFAMRGADEAGETLLSLLDKNNINADFLTIKTHKTITKLRILSMHQQLIRLDFEEHFAGIDKDSLINACIADFPSADALVLSDYGKGAVGDLQVLIEAARKMGVPVLVDPKTTDFSIYRGATLVTPNMKEFEAVVGPCSSEHDIVERGLALLREYNFDALLVTRGAQGMTLIQKDSLPFHLPTRAQDVFDVTGAGDTVIAVTAAALAAGVNMAEAVMLANTAAGLVVAKVGTATVTLAELIHALGEANVVNFGVVNEAKLIEAVNQTQAAGEKIVMTNGCFDILHSGHVMYLEQARALGDRLIVAVNDDASVSRLKGKNRPINNLRRRMEVLAALKSVDWVVPFSEDTPQRLIAEVLPNVLVKGGDWQTHQIAGAKEVLDNGGEVKVLGFEDGISTTLIVDKINEGKS